MDILLVYLALHQVWLDIPPVFQDNWAYRGILPDVLVFHLVLGDIQLVCWDTRRAFLPHLVLMGILRAFLDNQLANQAFVCHWEVGVDTCHSDQVAKVYESVQY